jgi:hypothetical protein
VLIVATVTDFGNITLQSWLVVLVAALAGIGVAIVPNSAKGGLTSVTIDNVSFSGDPTTVKSYLADLDRRVPLSGSSGS